MTLAAKHIAVTAMVTVLSVAAVLIIYIVQGWPEIALATAIPVLLGLINGHFLYRLPRLVALPAKQFLKRYAISRVLKAGLNLLVFGVGLATIFAVGYNLFRLIVVYLTVYFVFLVVEIAVLYTTTQRKGANHA